VSRFTHRWLVRGLAAAVVLLAGAGAAGAAETALAADATLGNVWTDNVYLTRAREGDDALTAGLRVGLDFASFWTADYAGSFTLYTLHDDLTSHEHTLRVMANPAWGTGDRDELLVVLALETLRNQDAYAAINFVGPRATVALTLEPAPWVAWQVALDVRYRRFYDDTQSDTFDVGPRAEVRFTLPSRTTLTPRVAYGLRYHPGLRSQGTGRPERLDHQVDVGLHASQGLWATGGLQADYAYRTLAAPNRLLPYQLTQAQFAFLTTDFLAAGHRAFARFTERLLPSLTVAVGVELRTLEYLGWPAVDAAGTDTGADRVDRRLGPTLSLAWRGRLGAAGVRAELGWAWLRQWSTSYDYDASGQQLSLQVGVDL
jgi:hypothetical protein